MDIQLTPKQTRALDYLQDKTCTELLFGGGAGGAKSFLGCLWIISCSVKYPRTRWLIGRDELKTLKDTTLITFFDVMQKMGISSHHFKYNEKKSTIKVSNGSVILLKDLHLYPSDPNFDSLGSLEISGGFIDECNQITEKAKNIVMSRIRYKLDKYSLIPKLLMTCNPAKNWVYNKYYSPSKNGTLDKSRKFIQALLGDNQFISRHYRENLLKLDEVSRERLLYGNWEYDDDPAKLIEYKAIINMFSNEFIKGGNKYITADIALHGSDKFVMGYWDGWRLEDIKTIDKCDALEVENAIKEFAERHFVTRSNICYDADGLGTFLRGYLKGAYPFVNGGKAIEVEYTREEYANLKTQCTYRIAKKINNNELYITVKDSIKQDIIIQELEQIKRDKVDDDKKLYLFPKKVIKENIGRSPDYSDMIMMREVFDIIPDNTITNQHAGFY